MKIFITSVIPDNACKTYVELQLFEILFKHK